MQYIVILIIAKFFLIVFIFATICHNFPLHLVSSPAPDRIFMIWLTYNETSRSNRNIADFISGPNGWYLNVASQWLASWWGSSGNQVEK